MTDLFELLHQSMGLSVGKIDQRNRFDDEVFTFRATKQGTVLISWYGKHVTMLKGKAAEQFLAQIDGLDHLDAQVLMAKATGNFKRGNERMSKERRKD